MYRVHCAVIFAIAQLSCIMCLKVLICIRGSVVFVVLRVYKYCACFLLTSVGPIRWRFRSYVEYENVLETKRDRGLFTIGSL